MQSLTDQEKTLVFALVCVPARFGLAMVTRYYHRCIPQSIFIAWLLMAISLGFYISEKRPTAFGSKRYWSSKVHSLLYLLAATLLLTSYSKYASTVLLIDLIYGIATVAAQYSSCVC